MKKEDNKSLQEIFNDTDKMVSDFYNIIEETIKKIKDTKELEKQF
jgi:nitrogen-specific signal transduction histidine kinase